MVMYFSWKQWLQAHLGQRACSALPCTEPAPSDSESSSKGEGVTAFQSCNTGLLVWVCADERIGRNSSLGRMAEGDRSLMLDVTLGKIGKEGELEFSFRIH